jgi:hypothetical protein
MHSRIVPALVFGQAIAPSIIIQNNNINMMDQFELFNSKRVICHLFHQFHAYPYVVLFLLLPPSQMTFNKSFCLYFSIDQIVHFFLEIYPYRWKGSLPIGLDSKFHLIFTHDKDYNTSCCKK